MVDVEKSDICSMSRVRLLQSDTVGNLKKLIGKNLNMDATKIMLAILNFQTESRILNCDSTSLLKESVSLILI